MVGGHALRYALGHPAIGLVTAIGRRTLGISHPKLKEVLHPDFADCMSKHVAISPREAADRLAIRELIEAYAHCADRRDAKGQMALFTTDTHFVVYMNAKDPT